MTVERRGEILFYSAAGGVVMGARESIDDDGTTLLCPAPGLLCQRSIEQSKAWAWALRRQVCYDVIHRHVAYPVT